MGKASHMDLGFRSSSSEKTGMATVM